MVFPSINLLFWSVLTPHVSVIIESMLNQAWSPGYLSIFLSKHFPLWPVSGPHTSVIIRAPGGPEGRRVFQRNDINRNIIQKIVNI